MGRRGFTMIEMALVFVIIAIMTATAIPKIRRILEASRVNRTAPIVAADLEQAFTHRRPLPAADAGFV